MNVDEYIFRPMNSIGSDADKYADNIIWIPVYPEEYYDKQPKRNFPEGFYCEKSKNSDSLNEATNNGKKGPPNQKKMNLQESPNNRGQQKKLSQISKDQGPQIITFLNNQTDPLNDEKRLQLESEIKKSMTVDDWTEEKMLETVKQGFPEMFTEKYGPIEEIIDATEQGAENEHQDKDVKVPCNTLNDDSNNFLNRDDLTTAENNLSLKDSVIWIEPYNIENEGNDEDGTKVAKDLDIDANNDSSCSDCEEDTCGPCPLYYFPCYLTLPAPPSPQPPSLLLYFHSNGEDMFSCQPFLEGYLQGLLKTHQERERPGERLENHEAPDAGKTSSLSQSVPPPSVCPFMPSLVVTMEYPGYSLYSRPQSADREREVMVNARALLEYWGTGPQVHIMGRSLGCLPSLSLSSLSPSLCSLCLVSPFLSLSALLTHRLGNILGALAEWGVKKGYDNRETARQNRVNTVIIHGKKDTLIPPSHSIELYSKLF